MIRARSNRIRSAPASVCVVVALPFIACFPSSASAASPRNAAAPQSRYVLDFSRAVSGQLDVTLQTHCAASPCDFILPSWNATYQLRDFSQHLTRVTAQDARGAALPLRKIGPSRWRLDSDLPPPAPHRPVVLRYRVRASRPGPFGAWVDGRRATLNLAQLLIFAEDARRQESELVLRSLPRGFKQALALEGGDGRYYARSYDRLVDTPVLLGDFSERSFEVAGKSIRVAALGPGSQRRIDSLADSAQAVVRAGFELMGELPFPSYLFAYVLAEEGAGGMEFRNGTLIFSPPACDDCGIDHLTAHEFFHLWNVKRIRPASMEPVDFTRANPSPSLWFAEGVTSTYAGFLSLDAGLMTEAQLLSRLAELIGRYQARPASQSQSAEDSSIEAWLERSPAYARPDRSVSYYLTGELIGHLLDLVIRHESKNRHSLDDLIRRLNQDFARQGRCFDDAAELERIASELAGADLRPVFDQLVRTPASVPWERYLGYAGLRLESRKRKHISIGLTLEEASEGRLRVASVAPGEAAEQAGLRAGDLLLKINSRQPDARPEQILRQLRKASRPIALKLLRAGVKHDLKLEPVLQVDQSFTIRPNDNPTPLESAVRQGWLRSQPNPKRK